MTVAAVQTFQTLTHQHGVWSSGALPSHLDSASTLVLACGTGAIPTDSGPMHELRGAFRSAAIIGCSTSHVSDTTQHVTDGVFAIVWKLRRTRLSLASAPIRNTSDSFRAGQLLGQQLMTPSLRGILMLADGQRTNGTQLLRGLHAAIGEQVTVIGGMSGHERSSDRHWVLRSGVPMEGFISAVGLYGSAIRFTQHAFSAWNGVGPWRRITRARDHTVFELDGQPAWNIYRQYLAEQSVEWASRLPLRVQLGNYQAMRTVRQVDPESGAISFAGDMPEGSLVQLAFSPSAPAAAPDEICAPQFNTLRLTCLGESRTAWMCEHQESGIECESLESYSASMRVALGGEFARNAQGQTELFGGSVTTTSFYEEEQ